MEITNSLLLTKIKPHYARLFFCYFGYNFNILTTLFFMDCESFQEYVQPHQHVSQILIRIDHRVSKMT